MKPGHHREVETVEPAEEDRLADLPSPDELPMRPLRHHLALTVYWLSNTVMWGALLHIALQTRLGDWFPEARVGYYLAVLGFTGGVVGTATQILAGAFSDRSAHPWGRRRPFVIAGSIPAIGALLLLGSTKSYWPFAGAVILVQLFTNIALGPFSALLPDTVNPREHGKASGFMGMARLAGDTGGLILAALLLSARPLGGNPPHAEVVAFHGHGMFHLCSIIAAFVLVTVAFTCWTIRERPLSRRPRLPVVQVVLGSFYVDIRGNPDFFWLSVSRAVTNVGFYMFLAVLLYFVQYSLRAPDPQTTTMYLMLPAIGSAVVTSTAAGILSDRVGRRPLVFAAQFLMTAAGIVFAVAPTFGVAVVAAVPAGLGLGAFTAVEWAFACNLLPQGEAARYLGVWNASAVVPQILAVPIASAIGSAISAHHPGLGWRVDFAVAAACSLIGVYFLRHVRERRHLTAGSRQTGATDAP